MKYILTLCLLLFTTNVQAANITCDIMVAFMYGDETVQTTLWIEGTILKEDSDGFVVDFTEGVKRRANLVGYPENYSIMPVKRIQCTKW